MLELVHGDLCGTISQVTASGCRYFLLVNYFSRYMWLYFLQMKDEVLGAFKKLYAPVEKGSDRRVKALRTDRGGEFLSIDFKEFCERNGIKRHYTIPFTAQQNGVVDHRNRTWLRL